MSTFGELGKLRSAGPIAPAKREPAAPPPMHDMAASATAQRIWGNQAILGMRSGPLGFMSDEESGPAPTDNDLIGQDAGPADAGPADAGPAPADAGPARADAGPAPADAGPAPADAGPAPADAGPAPADAGPAPADAGPGPADGGSAAGAPPPVAVAAPVIESKATVHAPDGTTDDRKTIGVAETINFTVGGGLVANWSANNGFAAARTALTTYSWAAPETPGTSTITATIPATGQTATLDMTVVAPKEIRMTSHDEIAFAAGTAGAGMHLTVRVLPLSVNFGWTSLLEDPGGASAVAGFFLAKQTAGTDLAHHPNPNFSRFNFNNTIQFDTAAAGGPPVNPPPAWAAGSFFWNIPNRYRASNSTGTGQIFTHTFQRFAIDAAGTVTITKQGGRVRRTP